MHNSTHSNTTNNSTYDRTHNSTYASNGERKSSVFVDNNLYPTDTHHTVLFLIMRMVYSSFYNTTSVIPYTYVNNDI